ncbi:MAG: hypothetical protein P1V81_18645 [Planctomycetota bacterium]|nr:hypothetical protein [Planctomycetota bacterium]
MNRVLLTGFGPFPGVTENPSGALAELLAAEPPPGLAVVSTVLPVTFADSPGALGAFVEAQEEPRPALLLSMGVHPGEGFRLERHARARPTSEKPDEAGGSGLTGELVGADRVRSTDLDLERLAEGLAEVAAGSGGVRVSEDAGGYVCDWTYQHLLQHGERLGVPALFLHVPPLDRVPLDEQRRVVERLLTLLVQTP